MKLNKILSALIITWVILSTVVLGYSTDSFDISVSDKYEVTEQKRICNVSGFRYRR